MPTEVIMPQMGESIFEGTITKWLKNIGDTVASDEPLFEISTDKVDAEIPSPVAGVLAEIRVPEGATVEVNTVVAVIGEAGQLPPLPVRKARRSRQPPPPPRPKESAPASAAALQLRRAGRIRSSPLARRMAKEHGLDLSRIAGTGAEGRITKEDILRALSQRHPPQTLSPKVRPTAGGLPHRRRRCRSIPAEPVPLTRMRSIIAERMVESMRVSPHVHTVYKIDMTRIVRLRERRKAAFEQRHGVKLTFMPFIAAAAVAALRRFPVVNASLESTRAGPRHPLPPERRSRYRRGSRLGPHRARHPPRRAAQLRRSGSRHRRSRRARPRQETLARRGRRVDLHAH